MKKLGAVAIVAFALLLGGCASEAPAEPESAPSLVAEPTQEAAPEVVEETSSPYGDYTQDEFYFQAVSTAWRGNVPDAAAIVSAGKQACTEMLAGTPKAEVTTFPDIEESDWNNEQIAYQAAYIYCPEVG